MTASISEQPGGAHASDVRPSREMVAELEQLVERGRVRWRTLILIEAASLAVATPLAYLWLVFLLDNVFHLPAWALLVANVAFLVCVVWAARRLVRSWRRARFTTDQVALAIEQRTPGGLENRLINALQLSRGAAAAGEPAMTEAAVGENYRVLRQMRLQQSAESRPVVLRAAVALLLVAMGIGFGLGSTERFTTSAGRLFLPLAGIEPVYRTRLAVTPGDMTVQAGQDVTVQVSVDGEVPEHVTLRIDDDDAQRTERLAVDPATATASHTFPAVRESLSYAVRGGDFRTPRYRITVPAELAVRTLEADLQYPDYTGLDEQHVESTTGDLEALAGTEASLTFTLNQPVAEAWLRLERASRDRSGGQLERIELSEAGPERFTLDYTFAGDADYVLEARRANGDETETPAGRLRATADNPPEVQLTGIEADSEVMLEDVLALNVRATDDFGLEAVGLFWRPVGGDAPEAESAEVGDWRPIERWDVAEDERTERFQAERNLLLSTLAVAEGDRLEIAGRARDSHPDRADRWTTGTTYPITATSPGASLQLTYEQILQTEERIDELIDRHDEFEREASRWIRQLEPDSGMRWDSQANLDALAEAMEELAAEQADIRAAAGAAARGMPPEAGENLQQALGMLADTEMVRHIRQLERVADGDGRQELRSALAEARLTVRRTIRSLGEMHERYIAFREDWELNHMVSFTQMLAERQERLAEASLSYMGLADEALDEAQHASIARRQAVVLELSGLARTAFEGLSRRGGEVGTVLAEGFADAAGALAEPELERAMAEAGELLEAGAWGDAERLQHEAAERLAAIHAALREAQQALAREAMDRLEALAEDSVEAQEALEKLREGFDENVIAMQDTLSVADTIRALEQAEQLEDRQQRQARALDQEWIDYEDHMSWLQRPHDDELDTAEHTLSDTFSPQHEVMEDLTPDGRNPAQTVAQDELEDVIGELIEGAEELKDDYTTYEATASWTVMDTGSDVSRGTEEPLSATGATATTGNQPPPADDVGGASRMGRLGARSHGLAVGDEFTNRRGREAQQGQENIPEQEGDPVQETLSDDPQEDAATGRGGREIDSDQTRFSTQDAGEWDDEIADEMNDPQDVHQIVERQGEPMDPEVAERMRDTENRQEQVIERIKTVKKELDELFLPTDHLEDIMARLEDNLDRLREAPDGTVFREQVELLDRLQASVIVFQRPSSEFVQSVPRNPRLEGQILDEKPAMPFPGYEEAVQRYYRRLVDLEDAP